jgi:hypothetical protein
VAVNRRVGPLMSLYRLSWPHRGIPAALLTGGGLIAA